MYQDQGLLRLDWRHHHLLRQEGHPRQGREGARGARQVLLTAPPPPRPTANSRPPAYSPSFSLSSASAPQGQVVKAVVVETKRAVQRPDGSSLKFDRNACVLVTPKGLPVGTRVLGFVTHELRARGMMKVLSLAARVF